MPSKALEIGFSNIKIPEICKNDLLSVGRINENQESTLIIGRRLFLLFIEQVNYVRGLGALSNDDVNHIREELLQLVDDLEKIVVSGKNNSGAKIWLYLSDLDVRGGYIYVQMEEMEFAVVDIYQIQWGVSRDLNIVKMHQLWLESLKKYATLLTASAEVIRNKFFTQQRQYINEML